MFLRGMRRTGTVRGYGGLGTGYDVRGTVEGYGGYGAGGTVGTVPGCGGYGGGVRRVRWRVRWVRWMGTVGMVYGGRVRWVYGRYGGYGGGVLWIPWTGTTVGTVRVWVTWMGTVQGVRGYGERVVVQSRGEEGGIHSIILLKYSACFS